MAAKRLSLIIPYRDRAEHMKVFAAHILKFFKHDKIDQHTPVSITVVEQEGGLPFNIGYVRNVGFDLTKDHDYHVFHDVDFLPIWSDHRYFNAPTRLLWFGAEARPFAPGSQLGAIHVRKQYFSGVVGFNREDFQKVNGYSNEYWGWGSEDDDIRERIKLEGLTIEHRDGFYTPLGHTSNGFKQDGTPKETAVLNRTRLERKFRDMVKKRKDKADGLSNLKYDVLSVYKRDKLSDKVRPQNLIQWQHVKVRLFENAGTTAEKPATASS